ncbi:cyclin-D-binding Myb-like transcription factor 1 isoform X1 [Nerophis lumbriciformis]|uniref:cyclin-D-binding Myb-like transcription factor 1 isoform X1 n=2 Tax=Nerophis lumbriciformis TaxID=546530 RepID=UPI002ADF9F4C|nr:cyclin-D-binding Myb-like transcription factor 1 isoform X1 [Nerophis lumbriciformis]
MTSSYQRRVMSAAEEERDGDTLETVESVTLTHDDDDGVVLHSPSNDDDCEPLAKKVCVAPEDSDSSFSVVAVPMADDHERFEVTMTTTAEGGLSQEGVAHIQVLREEALSANEKAEVSAVSQAWFTTKEDKDSLANKGHKWKQGMWSKEEIDVLMSNIKQYVKSRGMEDPAEIIFEMSKEERKDFYRSVALGLNRPLFAVYRRVLRMYDNRNHVGKYTPGEIEKLKTLRDRHGNDWAAIGAVLGRSASSVKDRCRLMKDTCNTGKWSEEEERRLAEVVYEMAGTSPGSAVTRGVSWASVANQVGTRSEKQCRSKWLNYLNWKHSGGTEWTKDDDLNLTRRILELEVEDENEIQWEELAGGWSSVRSPQWLRSKWWSIKRQIANHKKIPFNVLVKALHEVMASSQAASGSCSPSLQIRLSRLEESGAGPASGSVAALQIPMQIPLQITHLDSTTAGGDGDAITLSGAALQAFEILPSFQLQPTSTPGTYVLQTTSNQGLPISLANSGTVTLTTGSSSASHEHIILHSLAADSLCSGDGVIIQTLTSDSAPSDPLDQAELVVETEGQSQDASGILEGSEKVAGSEEPTTKEMTSSTPHPEIPSNGAVLIVSPPNISSTLTDPILENQEGSD